jgi:hypothetical protein
MYELSLSGLFSLRHKLFSEFLFRAFPKTSQNFFFISTVLRWSAHIRQEWGMGINLKIDGNYNAHKMMTFKNSSVQRTRVLRSTGPKDSRARLAIFRRCVTAVIGKDARQQFVFSKAIVRIPATSPPHESCVYPIVSARVWSMTSESLSPRYGVSSGCGRRNGFQYGGWLRIY